MGCQAALEKTLPAELKQKEQLHPRHEGGLADEAIGASTHVHCLEGYFTCPHCIACSPSGPWPGR